MGARGQNFYTRLAERYGYESEAAEIQDHYLAGRQAVTPSAAVPDRSSTRSRLCGAAGAHRRAAGGWRGGRVRRWSSALLSPRPCRRFAELVA